MPAREIVAAVRAVFLYESVTGLAMKSPVWLCGLGGFFICCRTLHAADDVLVLAVPFIIVVTDGAKFCQCGSSIAVCKDCIAW